MKLLPLQVLTAVLLSALILSSCADSSTDAGSGPAVVEGQVEEVSSEENQSAKLKDVEGAAVTAAEVGSDGSLETIGNAEAETNAQGQFTLEIEEDALTNVESASRIVVVAESEQGVGKTFVTSGIQSGSTTQAKPVTVETTAEANVLQDVVANGDESIVANADIEVAVDSAVAVSLQGNSSAVAEMASVMANQARLQSEFYAREGVEVGSEAVTEIKTDAQIELENTLNEVEGSEQEVQNAYNTFIDTYANAEIEAGIEASAAAKAFGLGTYIMLTNDQLPIETVAGLYRINSFKTAVLLDAGVRNQLEVAGAEQSTIDIAEDAGNTLQSEIRASAATASAEEIDAMFASYRGKIATAIEGDGSVDGTTFVTVANIINAEGGARAEFETDIEGSTDPEFILDAYTEFYSNVRSTVASSFTDIEDERIEAYVDLLILLNIAS